MFVTSSCSVVRDNANAREIKQGSATLLGTVEQVSKYGKLYLVSDNLPKVAPNQIIKVRVINDGLSTENQVLKVSKFATHYLVLDENHCTNCYGAVKQ